MSNDQAKPSEGAGWVIDGNQEAAGWNAAQPDQAVTKQIAGYEQKFRKERAANAAERHAKGPTDTRTTERDVTDANRTHQATAPDARATKKAEIIAKLRGSREQDQERDR